jgi:hypothetical protein
MTKAQLDFGVHFGFKGVNIVLFDVFAQVIINNKVNFEISLTSLIDE